jgi:pimeloyl-ACP methyl ester carboxylesterase
MVVLHGVHHLGIDEPRLMAFSRALAGQGIEVLTPELADIKDYRVTPRSIETIGAAMRHMRARGQRAGAFGLSFTGGLALMAAADPRYRDDVAFVVAVGAHDDMGRVARFFATSEIERPDGSIQRIPAHEYGALVLVYAHPEDFFPATDLDSVRACLKEVLIEVTCDSGKLSPSAQRVMQRVFAHDVSYFRDKLLTSAEKHAAEYDQVSPHGKLAGLSAPVLLLHGAGDDVIPPAETEWLAREIPPQHLDAVLISPAISHVEMGEKPTARDQFRVVHFLAKMIERAED